MLFYLFFAQLNHWQLPTCSRADKILHSIFLVCLIIMAACATITIICFKHVSLRHLFFVSTKIAFQEFQGLLSFKKGQLQLYHCLLWCEVYRYARRNVSQIA